MRKEDYKQLENKLQQNLEVIKKTDPFLYNEMRIIYEMLKDAEYPTSKGLAKGPLPKVTVEEAVILAAEFLENCSPKYKEKLLEDYSNGKIAFKPEKESLIEWNFYTLDYNINIEKTDPITMACDLVHEYFHSLNLNTYILRFALTETVSITAELMFLEFLKRKGYSDYDLNIVNQKRRHYYNDNLHQLKLALPLYLDKKENNTITEKTYRKLPEFVGMSQRNIDINLENILKTEKNCLETYDHTIGYIQSRMAICKGLSYQDLASLNESLKNANFKEFEDTLIGDDSVETIHTYSTREDFVYRPIQLVKSKE